MKNIQFVKVFSNDVSLTHDSIQALKSCPQVRYERKQGNSPAILQGKWIGKMVKLSGTMTTGIQSNNTVAGYEPTETMPFEITIFDGDVFTWESGSVCSFEHIRIER